jgi:hypothetical protein
MMISLTKRERCALQLRASARAGKIAIIAICDDRTFAPNSF